MAPEVVEETEVITEGKVVYEQDLRAGAHRNGRAPHLVEPTIEGPKGPTDIDPEEDGKHLPDRPAAQKLAIAIVYLGAGSLLIFAGILILRDLRKEKKA